MKRGEAYARSAEKRTVDLIVARGAYPAFFASRLLVRHYIDDPEEVVFEQKRVGQDYDNFVIFKLRTLNEEGEPINPLAARVRQLGLDETAQVANLLDGTMSAVGRRPIVGEEFENFMDSLSTSPKLQQQYQKIVMPTRPGIFNSYGKFFHEGFDPTTDQCIARAECDIADTINGSVVYDLGLIKQVVTSMLTGKFEPTELPG